MDPLQHLYIDLSILKNYKYLFFVEVDAKPRDTSTNAKLMFREELRDIQALQQMGSKINNEGLEAEYALIFNKRKEKMFSKPQPAMPVPADQTGKMPGGGNPLMDNAPSMMPDAMNQLP